MNDASSAHALDAIAPGLLRFDTGYIRQGHTACYVVEDRGCAAIIDTGVGASTPALLARLDEIGLARENVEWVIPTHVHLDHAGGAGALMQALPNARLGVHPSGAEHMIDPTRLEAGVRDLYGDAFFEREYAPLLPIAADRVEILEDEINVRVGTRILDVLHTPGHAWHHLSLLDTTSNILIAGDAFGASYPGYVNNAQAFAVPVVPPPQFKPEAYQSTLKRIVELLPAAVAPAHFPLIQDVSGMAQRLSEMLDAGVALAQQAESVADLEEKLQMAWSDWLPPGCAKEAFIKDFDMDIWLTAEGMWLWREKQEKKKAAQ